MCKKELEIQTQVDEMAIQELEKDLCQRVAAAKLNEAELIDNRSFLAITQVNWTSLKIGDQLEARNKRRVG